MGRFEFASFLNANKKEWGPPLRNLFSQWKYFYEKVCEREQATVQGPWTARHIDCFVPLEPLT
jgi:hypothetical protein